jgi:hypothetical protein
MTRYFIPILAQASEPSNGEAAASIGTLVFLLCALVIALLLWLLPGFIASARRHHNRGAIW